MAHFAKINIQTNEVEQVITINDSDIEDLIFPESEPIGQQFIQNIGLDGLWRQTSYNNNFRCRYAGIGYTYDQTNDIFIPPKPYQSWVLSKINCNWEPPIPYPNDDKNYAWDEETNEWILIS